MLEKPPPCHQARQGVFDPFAEHADIAACFIFFWRTHSLFVAFASDLFFALFVFCVRHPICSNNWHQKLSKWEPGNHAQQIQISKNNKETRPKAQFANRFRLEGIKILELTTVPQLSADLSKARGS